MYKHNIRLLLFATFLMFSTVSKAQSIETDCNPLANLPITNGDVNLYYGSSSAVSFRNRTSVLVGQPIVGISQTPDYNGTNGYYMRFLLPPSAPVLRGSGGDFPDRILLAWDLDPLSPFSEEGFTILRDGAFLAEVGPSIRQFIDFNVQAGELYNYTVFGSNQFGDGVKANAIGFVNPNGTVSGTVNTLNDNPVPGAVVRLYPLAGTSLVFNGINDQVCITHHNALPGNMWTLATYVKIGSNAASKSIVDFGSHLNKNFWIHTSDGTSGKGIEVGIGTGSSSVTMTHNFTSDPDDWHQVAMVYNGSSLLLYVDGKFVNAKQATISNVNSKWTIGSTINGQKFFDGKIDDVRLFDRPLTASEILQTKDLSPSKGTDGLVSYFKFDEGMGQKVFDISPNRMQGLMMGPIFSSDKAPIINAGITDGKGFYSIDGINYSKSELFTAVPSKSFYQYSALEFNDAYQSRVDLTDFDLSDSFTLELVVHPFDLTRRQSILTYDTDFDYYIENNNAYLNINGQNITLAPASASYKHLAFRVLDGELTYYENGNLIGTHTLTSPSMNFSGDKWRLGSSGAPHQNFYTGLIDEFAYYNIALTLQKIQLHASPVGSGGTDVGDANLKAWFSLDEGEDGDVYNTANTTAESGTIFDASWSTITYKQKEYVHLFRPSERKISINTSNTALSGVDFIDESTIPISGVVRFENTFCYQDSVEILVNGQPNFPPIFTNSQGKFIADFEPGKSLILSPKFRDHKFSPPFYEARKINRPIANILFANLTKREVSGQVAGGHCKHSVIPQNSIVKVKAKAQNDCYEQIISFDASTGPSDGKFRFENLPPIPLTFTVSHNLGLFSNAGGEVLDLRGVEKDTVDFIYISPPNVEIQPFEENGCAPGQKMIDQSLPSNGYKQYKRNVRVYEDYFGSKCYLDSFNLIVNNNIGDQEQYSAVSDSSTYVLKLWAGLPNINAPYTKFLQVTAEVNGALATGVEDVVVLGERNREATFTTASPVMPQLILRDPPGDASSATLSKGKTKCTTWSNGSLFSLSENLSLEVDLGAKVTTYAGSPFGGIITETEMMNNVTISGSLGAVTNDESAGEVCLTTEEAFSTSSGDAVVGPLADLYVGAAVNFEFSTTDNLNYNPGTCSFNLTQGIKVAPSGFGTRYIYSEWQILTDVIPSLLALDPPDNASVKAWQNILDYNKQLKNSAKFVENISFDALNVYSKTTSSSTTNSYNFTTELNWSAAYNQTLGFEVFEVGAQVSFGFDISGSSTSSQGSSTNTTTSVNFTLADDDPNDNYSIDILDDAVFGTPVFKLKAGETMCPWEPGSLNREEVGFTVDRLTAINVPENETAVFNLKISNNGQTGNDPLVYRIGKVSGTNPNGANYTVNGSDFDELTIQLQPGETQTIQLDITKGTTSYSYQGLGIYMASECQWEHSLGLGYDISGAVNNPSSPMTGPYKTVDLKKFYKEFKLNVEFIEPCTPVGIGAPLQDWVMTPASGDVLFISLNDYIYDDPDLKEIKVQYRVTGGDGLWVNIVTLPKSAFENDPLFKIVQWDMEELADGPYEIRAISFCNDVSLSPGISEVIKGRKETRPPQLFGIPQPSDGLLSPGDEISVTFSKRVNCNMVFPADGIGTNINLNNMALQDMTIGGVLIEADFVCKDEKIIIIPKIAQRFIENHTLRVTATAIKDLYGNAIAEPIVWEFYVNQSNLYWHGGDIDEVVLQGNELMVRREIRNQSGERTSFNIADYPDWMQIFPTSGALDPGQILPVNFIFPADLVNGAYSSIVNMTTVDGDEPLMVNLRVACPQPEWEVNSANYSFSMNIVAQLDIEGGLSNDKLDRVGAFIYGELRGIGKVEYSRDLQKYLVFLTIYSNTATGETINFKIWDASACQLYGTTLETFPYEADGLIGTLLVPQVIHTDGVVEKKIFIHPGWNWLSYNIDLVDNGINPALSSLTNPQGGLFKSQTQFSIYANSWIGNLSQLSHLKMYQYNSLAYDSLLMLGAPVDQTTPLPLVAGWNWVSYLPQFGLPVTTALSSLDPVNGDVIKSQESFAQFLAGVGWIGNLKFLNTPNGYLLKLANIDTLRYPSIEELSNNIISPLENGKIRIPEGFVENAMTHLDEKDGAEVAALHWSVSPEKFEFNMNAIAIVVDDDNNNLLNDGDEVAAFVGDEVRGVGNAIFVPSLDRYLLFMTLYSNKEGEVITFKYYNKAEQKEIPIIQKVGFSNNSILGLLDSPKELQLQYSVSTEDDVMEENKLMIYPNPAQYNVYINYTSMIDEEVDLKITNVLGSEIMNINQKAVQGRNVIEWKPALSLPNGLYMVTLKSKNETVTRSVELIR